MTRRSAPPPLLALSLAASLAAGVACDKPAAEQPAQPSTPAAPAPTAAPTPAPAPTAPAAGPSGSSDMAQGTAAPPAVAEARPLYYERALTKEDLAGRTLRELTLMRNSIYARAGQSFRKPWLDQHFRKESWYAPKETPDLSKLTPIDYANAQAIVMHEQDLEEAVLEAMQKELLAKKKAGKTTPEDDIELELLAVRLGGWTTDLELMPEDLSPLADPTKLDALLTANQLATLSLRDLRILRNTIYARRGRPFRSVLLQDYYAGMDWYKPDESYTDAKLTAIDKKNIRMIMGVEKANGGPLSDYGHKVEEGWFIAA
jgi:hypothetical protein